ncbi:hypothetical protein BCR44DRAFT_1455712 [Catenaria anguillulae PL171]|uniref:Uncharacterized protein n=1 Tax=Catenaria anguillulae PL171 TaxID=765915 RepID=A0A1Y2GXZ2_9FUNG|nr:hypothetical protein BCR44DRAFT_1455712 [Catenaria anguillulae PL171]
MPQVTQPWRQHLLRSIRPWPSAHLPPPTPSLSRLAGPIRALPTSVNRVQGAS